MRPTEGTRVYRPDLGAVVEEGLGFEDMGYIGMQLMPPIFTLDDAGSFLVLPEEAFNSMEDTSRAPRGAYNRSDWTYEDGVYHTREHGHEQPIDDSERKKLERRAGTIAVDSLAVKRARGIIARGQEKRIAGIIQNESNFYTESASAAINASADPGNPIEIVRDGVAYMRNNFGILPNVVQMNWLFFESLKVNPFVVDRLKYTFPGTDIQKLTAAQVAHMLDVPQVLIGGALYNSAQKNKKKTVTLTEFWDPNYIFLGLVSHSEDELDPCCGRTFVWTEDSAEEPIVETYREEQTRSDIYRVRHQVGETLLKSVDDSGTVVTDVSRKCGMLIKGVYTT